MPTICFVDEAQRHRAAMLSSRGKIVKAATRKNLAAIAAGRCLQPVALMVLCALSWLAPADQANAHAGNENYVWVDVEEERLSVRFEMSNKDIESFFDIDIPSETEARLDVLRSNAPMIVKYLSEHFSILIEDQPVSLDFVDITPAPGAEDKWNAFNFVSEPVVAPAQMTIRNSIMIGWDDPLHRSLALTEYNRLRGEEYGAEFIALVFGPTKDELVLDYDNLGTILTEKDFVWQGVIHVLAGPDHVLFLLGLLLTAVLILGKGRKWQPIPRFRPALINAIVIVTVFAIAHSITLTLTVLGYIQPNIQLIETLIAFSIVVVALNNLYPVFNGGKLLVIVFFGLFHGMGFASAMGDLQFRLVEPSKILLNFNIGIEIGQIIILLIVLPVLYLIRDTALFRKAVFPGINIVIILIAGYWTVTRALGV